MKLIALKEAQGEPRCALSPETARKFAALGLTPMLERSPAPFAAADYEAAGVKFFDDPQILAQADIVLAVRPPAAPHLARMKKGAVLAGLLEPHRPEAAAQFAGAGLSAFALERLPRITRAQSMDALSSQANLAGYRAVIEAAACFARAFPMMMTAAGTVAPARLFVMGAGVAGLQAIATARRLGARVSATDVRRAAGEQIESLGAEFVMVEDAAEEAAETEAGYAREMSRDYQRRQAELIARTIARQDIVICTALIPGKPAPRLISPEMVRSMKPGSVIVDLAAPQGGNCALSQPGQTVRESGVAILAPLNMAGMIAADASALYARNLYNFIAPMIDPQNKTLAVDWDDEIIAATAIARSRQTPARAGPEARS